MPSPSLANRQTALLKYLADPASARSETGLLLGTDVEIDRERLRFCGEMHLRKQQRRLHALLPVTCAQIGDAFEAMSRKFLGTLQGQAGLGADLAESFREFLAEQELPAGREFVADVAAVEMALLHVAQDVEQEISHAPAALLPYRIVACRHDVRPMFDRTSAAQTSRRREVFLVVSRDREGRRRVAEVARDVYEGLRARMSREGGSVA
ncbi:MAG: hypothetical protein JO128_00780 [Alphaproteobacteria bacterium]|nr:hypothetical protein [Alphaproteobacteria bacterium]